MREEVRMIMLVGIRPHGTLYQIMEGFVGHCKELAFIMSKMEATGGFGAQMRLIFKGITMPGMLRGD